MEVIPLVVPSLDVWVAATLEKKGSVSCQSSKMLVVHSLPPIVVRSKERVEEERQSEDPNGPFCSSHSLLIRPTYFMESDFTETSAVDIFAFSAKFLGLVSSRENTVTLS